MGGVSCSLFGVSLFRREFDTLLIVFSLFSHGLFFEGRFLPFGLPETFPAPVSLFRFSGVFVPLVRSAFAIMASHRRGV